MNLRKLMKKTKPKKRMTPTIKISSSPPFTIDPNRVNTSAVSMASNIDPPGESDYKNIATTMKNAWNFHGQAFQHRRAVKGNEFHEPKFPINDVISTKKDEKKLYYRNEAKDGMAYKAGRSIAKSFANYCNRSTLHGLRYVGDTEITIFER